jgi:hypothetical protein
LCLLTGEKDISERDLDELDELEDSEDEDVLLQYRLKRIAEMRATASKARYGSVREISGQDYVGEVNKAGDDVWVVLHLYSRGVPFCSLLNQYLNTIAQKYPQTKCLRAIATTCIENYPERNLPTIFVYYEGKMVKQYVGTMDLRGTNLTIDEFEYLLGKAGAVPTEIKEDPRVGVKDKMFSDLADVNDW